MGDEQYRGCMKTGQLYKTCTLTLYMPQEVLCCWTNTELETCVSDWPPFCLTVCVKASKDVRLRDKRTGRWTSHTGLFNPQELSFLFSTSDSFHLVQTLNGWLCQLCVASGPSSTSHVTFWQLWPIREVMVAYLVRMQFFFLNLTTGQDKERGC